MWKTYQDDNKVKKNIRLAIFSLVILFLLLVLGKTISIIGEFNLPFTKNLSDEKSRVWDGKTSYNLVFASEKDSKNLSQISLINFNPTEKKITVLHLSDMIYSELPKGYGSWRVGSIYPLGEEEGEQKGAQLLKLSVSKILALPVDGIFITKRDFGTAENLWTRFWKNPVNLNKMLSQSKTDLTPWEFVRLLNFSSGIRADKVVSLELSQSSITESKLLPDSTRVLGINYVSLDSFLRDNLVDSLIYEENTTVAVFNASEHSGLAQEVARVATNLGASVVIVSNTEKKTEKTLVVANDESRASVTFERLSGIFAPDCLKQNCFLDDPKIKNSRAQINVILGEDYYKYWYQR